jgi:molybdopterin molybdotransferase
MRTVEEHLTAILSAVPQLQAIELPLLEAEGTVLAESVGAPIPLPPFDNSAMDGYAVCAADIAAASESSPVTLPVIGDVMAGDVGVSAIRNGMCTRIMTGAPMPAGADAVVPVEWTDGGTVSVRIARPASPGHYIRRAGEDVPAGQVVLRPGTRLGATQLGMLAALGRSRIFVRPKPRIVVLSTGSELREPGTELDHGQIWDSNSYMLTAAVAEAGGIGYRETTVMDDPDKVLETIQDQLVRADAVVTSGGVSMGARDVVKEVLSGMAGMEFCKVAMRPGKPQGFGLLGGGKPIFTLPGNPVSAYVSFQVFVRPALRAMQGLQTVESDEDSLPPSISAVLTEDITSPPGLRHYLRGALRFTGGFYSVTPTEGQGSHQLASLAAANCLIVMREDQEGLPAGAQVEVMRLP